MSDNNLEYIYEIDGKKYRKHKNGGGYVASTALVYDNVFVSKNSMVKDYAVVQGNVRLYNNVIVEGCAHVCGDCELNNDVVVTGHASVEGDIAIFGSAIVSGHVKLYGRYEINGGVFNKNPLIINGNDNLYTIIANYNDKVVHMGCQSHHIDYWLEHGVEIARSNGFSEEKIDEYENHLYYVKLCLSNKDFDLGEFVK
jgi:cytoskeletal protein CcmA (bactofilin family)